MLQELARPQRALDLACLCWDLGGKKGMRPRIIKAADVWQLFPTGSESEHMFQRDGICAARFEIWTWNEVERRLTFRLHRRQELDTARRCSPRRLAFHLEGQQTVRGFDVLRMQLSNAHADSEAGLHWQIYSLTVTVSLILKLQSTWLMFLAWKNPFPLTTTWKDSKKIIRTFFPFLTQRTSIFLKLQLPSRCGFIS